MQRFLEQVTENIVSQHKNLSNGCIVFPSQRSRLYFTDYLAKYIKDKPIWSPSFVTIGELFQQQSNLQIADPLLLTYHLYESYSEIRKSKESFDQFFYWGNMLLSDFDDVDKYLIDSQMLFSNLRDLKDIENDLSYLEPAQIEAIKQYWNVFNTDKLEKHQEFFLDVWKDLFSIYTHFRKKIREKQMAYEGMICRDIAEQLKQNTFPDLQHSFYAFVGFNALNECEKTLFRFLRDNHKGTFYWDYDQYYLKNDQHEAGLFMRQNILEFPSPLPQQLFNNFASKKTVKVYPIPSQTGQAKMMSEILSQIHQPTDNDWRQTVVALGDEQLLQSTLYSIPDAIDNINITMGYPVKLSGIAILIKLFCETLKNVRPSSDEPTWYYRNVLNILHHPIVQSICGDSVNSLSYHISNRNIVYPSKKDLHIHPLLSHLFEVPADGLAIIQHILDLCSILISIDREKAVLSEIEKENIYVMFTSMNRLKDTLSLLPEKPGKDLSVKIIDQYIQTLILPFEGEPLKGLQIMGLLETRTLDFKNVILMSMNEGVFPKTSPPQSFIPYNLRKGYGLPTIEHQDAIFSYYFYRLLQRAENISIIYNSSQDKGLQSNEMSRYVMQLKYEWEADIKWYSQTFDIKPVIPKVIRIVKNDKINAILSQYLEGGSKSLSPSAISKYIDCPLRFYFSYIAGIKETEEVLENIDEMALGKILHKSLELIYHEFQNEIMTADMLKSIAADSSKIEAVITDAIYIEFFKSSSNKRQALTGKNLIILRVIAKYIKQLLLEESKLTPFKVKGLEMPVQGTIDIEINKEIKPIRLSGYIDRMDETTEGHLRIIDYKTGQRPKSSGGITAIFESEKEKRDSHQFQIFCYAMMIQEANKNTFVIPAIIYLRDLFIDFNWNVMVDNKKVEHFNQIAAEYIPLLKESLKCLFDPNIPFHQTTIKERCKYCSFSSICMRG